MTDVRCRNPKTRKVAEPYTPAAFEIECCEECAQNFIDFGYIDKGKLEDKNV